MFIIVWAFMICNSVKTQDFKCGYHLQNGAWNIHLDYEVKDGKLTFNVPAFSSGFDPHDSVVLDFEVSDHYNKFSTYYDIIC